MALNAWSWIATRTHAFSAGATGSQVVREIDSERTLMPL
jgi:hypothetical protein